MANKCISLDNIPHYLGCDGSNAPGIVASIIYGAWDDVDVWPDEPKSIAKDGTVTPISLDEAGALNGDVAMKPGCQAYQLEFTQDSGTFSIKTEGDIDSMSVTYTLDIVKARINKTFLGFINAAMSNRMFFIVEDNNGTHYLMGGKKRACNLASGGDGSVTGTKSGDRNQTTVQFTYSAGKALVYEGVTDELLKPVPPSPPPSNP